MLINYVVQAVLSLYISFCRRGESGGCLLFIKVNITCDAQGYYDTGP